MTRRPASASCATLADEPLRWIAENGGENGYVIVTKVREGKVGEGYNAATGEYGDLVAQGVLDPVKVTRSALVNATSIAGMLLTTETLVVEKPEDEEPAPRPATVTGTATDRTPAAAKHKRAESSYDDSARSSCLFAPTRRVLPASLRRLGGGTRRAARGGAE